MPGQRVDFPANGRTVSGYLAAPAAAAAPGVVLIQEWWGLVGHITDVADRLAAEGFVVLAPDLFHGTTTRSPDAAGKLLMALDIARAGTELRGAADYLLQHHAVRPKRIGVVGFCMGGQLALHAGQEHPDRFSAVVDFYGVHPRVEIHPDRFAVPVLAHFGRRDDSVPEDRARELVRRFRAAGKRIEAHFYDAGHAFFNDDRPEVYDEHSAELAWERTVEFLRRQLREDAVE